MGWNFVCQIARFNKVIAITRENNQPHIEKYIKENPNEIYNNIQFLYFDLPVRLRWWKKGSRGAMLYYWLWQKGVVSFIKKQKVKFDIVHNLNFHNDWTPSYLWRLNKPMVWGPIGHHPIIPKQYLKPYSIKYRLVDLATWLIKKAFWNLSASLHKTVKNADHILCMNKSVSGVINLKNKDYAIMPSVASEDLGYKFKKSSGKFTLISAGRLVPLKGFDLSILAFASFLKQVPEDKKDNCELIIVGSGPELDYYKKLSQQNQILKYVKFINWIERDQLLQLFKSSSAFLFPSHEGAGMVVSEALSFGLPVICLDKSGPVEFIDNSCGYAIPHQNYSNTVQELGNAILELFSNPKQKEEMGKQARKRYEEYFHWDRRGELINDIYLKL